MRSRHDQPQTLDPSQPTSRADRRSRPDPGRAEAEVASRQELVIICYSGDLERTWASLILATTAAASGVPTKVFLTFWGLQTFVKDRRPHHGPELDAADALGHAATGHQPPKLSKMNFLGMGPWMMRKLAKQYGVASPKELLEAAQPLGVEFMPCQMTMDMFGLTREDMIDGLGEPVGAATVIELHRRRRRAALHLTTTPPRGPLR